MSEEKLEEITIPEVLVAGIVIFGIIGLIALPFILNEDSFCGGKSE